MESLTRPSPWARQIDLHTNLARPPAFCFITFNNPRDADDAVRARDGQSFKDLRLRVEFARGSQDRGPAMGHGPPRDALRPPPRDYGPPPRGYSGRDPGYGPPPSGYGPPSGPYGRGGGDPSEEHWYGPSRDRDRDRDYYRQPDYGRHPPPDTRGYPPARDYGGGGYGRQDYGYGGRDYERDYERRGYPMDERAYWRDDGDRRFRGPGGPAPYDDEGRVRPGAPPMDSGYDDRQPGPEDTNSSMRPRPEYAGHGARMAGARGPPPGRPVYLEQPGPAGYGNDDRYRDQA